MAMPQPSTRRAASMEMSASTTPIQKSSSV